MKELEDHLQLVCKMIEDEYANFHCFLRRLKRKTGWLSQFPYSFLSEGGMDSLSKGKAATPKQSGRSLNRFIKA